MPPLPNPAAFPRGPGEGRVIDCITRGRSVYSSPITKHHDFGRDAPCLLHLHHGPPSLSRFFFQPRAANVSAEPPRSARKQGSASAWRRMAGSGRWQSVRPASWDAEVRASPSPASGPAPPKPRSSRRRWACSRSCSRVAELKPLHARPCRQLLSTQAHSFSFHSGSTSPNPQALHNYTTLCSPKPESRSSFSSLFKCQSGWRILMNLWRSCMFLEKLLTSLDLDFFLIWKLKGWTREIWMLYDSF